jgi:hypothetical protein
MLLGQLLFKYFMKLAILLLLPLFVVARPSGAPAVRVAFSPLTTKAYLQAKKSYSGYPNNYFFIAFGRAIGAGCGPWNRQLGSPLTFAGLMRARCC